MNEAIQVILIAAGIALGLSGGLSMLLLVAERYLVNYGPCKIDINRGEKDIELKGGETLLQSLKNNGVYLASACGGRGTCAYCKCKVLEGGGPVSPTETPLLSEQEIQDQVRISCQVKVRNDMRIEVPEELLAVQAYTGRVERIRDLTHDIKELRIKLLDPPEMKYRAGHYVQLEAPAYGDNPAPTSRAYSVSSPPSDKGYVELIIRLVPGGIVTTWVFEHLQEGRDVNLTGPFGEFRLSESDAPMVWIAGGSGMAPFWSMVRHMKEHGIARPTKYFFGAVSKRDLFFVDELNQLAEELPWFEFIPALSGPKDEDQWTGETGLITEVVDRHVEQDTPAEGYLCGSPGMCDASVKVLTAKGIPDEKIFFDKFA
jgi:Na+-transporting NADH:ubiquinone oxidoreductase subunit F